MANVKLEYFKNLDGLRGIAAFSVIVFHFFLNEKVTKNVVNIDLFRSSTEILQHGVTLFFVLSGFVITRILLNTKENDDYFSRFYKRRALRIFPLYYLYLIFHNYIFPWIFEGSPNFDFSRQFVQYFYLQNMTWLTGWSGGGPGHFWSLAVEEHFYLLWPLFIYLMPKNIIKATTIILLLASIPLKWYFFENGIDINKNTFSRYDSIMIGCLIAILERDANYDLKPLNKYFVIITTAITLLIGSLVYFFQENIPVIKAISKYLILGVFFGIIIYIFLTIRKDHIVNRFLNHKIMQYFGKLSYGLYVWHVIAIFFTSLFAFNNYVLNLLLTFIITIILSHLSYYYEKWFFKFK